jgi:hypothetical protein
VSAEKPKNVAISSPYSVLVSESDSMTKGLYALKSQMGIPPSPVATKETARIVFGFIESTHT